MAVPQPSAPVPIPQQSFLHQHNCPKCGASIDHELGRCTGCGLLYGVKHRVTQQAAAMPAAPIQRPPASWPQSSMGQQPPAAHNAMPQHNIPRHNVASPNLGQQPNYMPAAAMPPAGMLMPIPRIAPAVPGVMPPGTSAPPTQYQPQAAPPASIERRPPASGKGGLSGFATTIIILMICLLVGGGIYYFFIRNETAPAVNNVENVVNNPVKILDVTVKSTTETGATIKWTTDKPATGRVEVRDANDALISEAETADSLADKQSVTISGLQPDTKYYYTVISTDADGNEATKEGELVTRAVADADPPAISAISVGSVTESSALITWLTDEPATGMVKYSTSENVTSTTAEKTDLDTTHSIMLTKLNSGTTYSFTILSKDAAGNAASLAGTSFKTVTPVPVGTEIGNRAPDFSLTDLSGNNVKLSDFRGKIVMINFWAIWCGPCVEELPYIQAVSDNWSAKGVQVLAVAAKNNEPLDMVGEFIDQNKYTFRVLYDSQGINSIYNVSEIPITFFIDKEGIIRNKHDQFDDQATIEEILSTMQ
jgi:peroxiredoxin